MTKEKQKWEQEFGAEYAVPAEITNHPLLMDMSWHNEACPQFSSFDEAGSDEMPKIALWADHPDARNRELPGGKRYLVSIGANSDDCKDVLETDDVNAALAKFIELAIALPSTSMEFKVVAALHARGVECYFEYQGWINIPRASGGSGGEWNWAFGTANDYWTGDLCHEGNPEHGGFELPFLSDHQSDGKDIAEFIAAVVKERNHPVLEIDGKRVEISVGQFISDNHLGDPAEIMKVLRLKPGESCTLGGGAAALVTITNKEKA